MVWGICIGISMATGKKAHLGIDIFVSFAPPKARHILGIISTFLLVVTYMLLTVLSVQFVMMALNTGNVSPILRIPFWQLYLALPIGFVLSTIRAIQVLVQVIRGKDETAEEVIL